MSVPDALFTASFGILLITVIATRVHWGPRRLPVLVRIALAWSVAILIEMTYVDLAKLLAPDSPDPTWGPLAVVIDVVGTGIGLYVTLRKGSPPRRSPSET